MKKALVVGIDHYQALTGLRGCVNDATSMAEILARNGDGSPNFDVRLLTTAPDRLLTRHALRGEIADLFTGKPDVALLYFAGHGHAEDGGGYICASDAADGTDGLAMTELMNLATRSQANNKIIVLDSCFSGKAGNRLGEGQAAEIPDGMTVLTASTEYEPAKETNGHGVFTSLFVDALSGAAANLLGQISPGAIYAHIDQSLGAWGQRPVFKTNIQRFVSLRSVTPPLNIEELRQLAHLFPHPDHHIALDPSFEPERSEEQVADGKIPPPDPYNTAVFRVLQNYVKVNLVRPVDAPHMWHAAMWGKSCQLTAVGKHYRQLVADGRI